MADPQSYRPTEVPKLPGVYRFYDGTGKIIYVGKALNLKNRLNSYFQGNLESKTYRMVHQAVRVDWTIVDTEVEALQLEFSWIKQYSPLYNIQFRDDKSYPYLAITSSEEFPRIFITRKPKRLGISYFGPFTHTWALRNAFDIILKTFPIRSCTASNFERAVRAKHQCLLGDIGRCTAPCIGNISSQEHKELAMRLIKFLSSGSADIASALKLEMKLASDREEFERANKIKASIASLERTQESSRAAIDENLSADIVAIHHDGAHAAGSIFIVRAGSIKGSRSWIVDQRKTLEGDDEMGALFYSIYNQSSAAEIPAQIYINERPFDADALEAWLTKIRGASVSIKVPKRGEKVELVATVKRNAQYALIQYLSKRSNDASVSHKALIEIEEALNLACTPLRIECFDISNISGTLVVASMVVFEDGVAKKSEYRRFVIDTSDGFDDTKAMHQVLTRRLKRLLNDRAVDDRQVAESGGQLRRFSYQPQLIVVDGGKGQVSAAARALAELGITDIALCGLAKRFEEIWLPGARSPLILPRTSEALYLMQRIRDEAHRFAITFHRSRRSKAMLESILDEIELLGQVRRKALLEHFGSVAAIRKASIEDIASVPGIGAKIALLIFERLASIGSQKINADSGEIF